MVGEILVSATSEEEALTEVLQRLGVEREAIDYEVHSEAEDSLLAGAKPQIEMRAWIRSEFMAEKSEAHLRKVLDLMEFDYELSVSIKNRIVYLDLDAGEESSLLIGKGGQNLGALQYLINRMTLRSGREAPMVLIDIEGYRQRQYQDLEKLVNRAVDRARDTGNEIELDPMPPSDRKYLHNYLQQYDGVQTFSRGEEPERYLVIIAD